MLLGTLVGFLAGLLGIGGGLIVVPALLYLLPLVGIQEQFVMLLAIATSLANMVLTSTSAVAAHHRRNNISWSIAKIMVPGVIIGALSSGTLASLISANQLQQLFAVFVILMAINMARPVKPQEQALSLPVNWLLFIITTAIAMLSGMLGIGGGVMLVPLLCFFGLKMNRAVGLSSLMGLCVAMAGSIGYIIAGWNVENLPAGTLGYIYLPALFGIAFTSILVAPIGVKAAMTWPTSTLKKVFSVLLICIGLELVFSSFGR